MPTIFDYLQARKEASFEEMPLNRVDMLCLNELGYIAFEKLLPDSVDLSQPIQLASLLETYDSSQLAYDFMMTKERVELCQLIFSSERFKDLTLSHYVSDTDLEFEKQFAAMLLTLPSIQHQQVIFRGTDDSLIGWKEDFKLTYMREIPAHRSAIAYLKEILQEVNGDIVVSGHSKGGNLALYASSHIDSPLQDRIPLIYLFDSPGLQKEELVTQGYLAIKNKCWRMIPRESIVGIMLYFDLVPDVVDSQLAGISQHDVAQWQVTMDGQFDIGYQQTELSLNLEKTFKEWTDKLSNQELKLIFDLLFDSLMDNGIYSLNDFSLDSLSRVFQALTTLNGLDPQKKQVLNKSLRLLISSYTSQLRYPSLPDLPKINFPNFFDRK